MTKFGIFSDPVRKLSALTASRPNAAEYCNSEKKLVKGVLQRTFFISTNERLMYKFYKNCNYFIFK